MDARARTTEGRAGLDGFAPERRMRGNSWASGRDAHSSMAVEITLVKGQVAAPEDRDRVYVEVAGEIRRAAVHVGHDLPHLVVESLFDVADGALGELAAGLHSASGFPSTARDPKRQEQGRSVSGAASDAGTQVWLSEGDRTAKTVTNAVVNCWGDGPDTPAGVRSRLAR